MKRKIHQWSLLYLIIRTYVYIAHKLFYSKIVINGLDNIPVNTPVILTPNHQNAFMDALIIVCSVPGQTVFMARADVFQNKLLAGIFRFLKIMPIYRLRDGYEHLEKNNAIFEDAIDVLANRKILCIMPEGTHSNRHILRQLVKGTFRIALSASERFPELSPVIVPVGIEYSNYTAFRSQIIIQYGKPVSINEFSKRYNENPAQAINQLRDRTSLEMQKLMIHIDCVDLYETIDYMRLLYRPLGMRKLGYTNDNPWYRYLADKWFTDTCNIQYQSNPSLLYELKDDVALLRYKLDTLGLQPGTLVKKVPRLLKIITGNSLFLILFPFFAAGHLLHAGLIYFPKIFTKNIEDTQFHSSIKYTVTSLLFPFYYGLLWFLISLYINSFSVQLIVIAGIAFTGEFACWYHKKYLSFVQLLRLKFSITELRTIYPLWKKIIKKTDILCNCPKSNIM
jgi:1-acyl-sn-glycerol-3-phosphate acyltransferase